MVQSRLAVADQGSGIGLIQPTSGDSFTAARMSYLLFTDSHRHVPIRIPVFEPSDEGRAPPKSPRPLPTRQVVTGDPPRPPVELETIAA
jgi:hypothetical protein